MLRLYVTVLAIAAIFAVMVGKTTAPTASRRDGVIMTRAADATSGPSSGSAEESVNRLDGSVELDRQPDGHFYADVRINGNLVRMMVDTGASGIALARDDARVAGLAPSIGMSDVVGEGADGAVRGEYVRLDRVELGPLSAENMDAVVLNGGQQSLLGQSFLSKFKTMTVEGDRMVLR
jgi:aspartyl protease family protein